MKRLRHNVLRERITTILGVVLFVATLASVFLVAGINWGDAWVPMAISLLLILMPDRALGIVRRVADRKQQQVSDLTGPLALVVGLLAFASCAGRSGVRELPAYHPAMALRPDTASANWYRPPGKVAPLPGKLTKAGVRRLNRANKQARRNVARYDRQVARELQAGGLPRKIKARGPVTINLAPGGTATNAAPAVLKVSGSGTVALAPGAVATNNTNAGRRAAGGVNLAPAGIATGSSAPAEEAWWKPLARAIGAVLFGAGVVGLVFSNARPIAVAWLQKRFS